METCHLIDQIYTYLMSDVAITAIISAGDYNIFQQSSRSQAPHGPEKTLCDPFKSLHIHNANFVKVMH